MTEDYILAVEAQRRGDMLRDAVKRAIADLAVKDGSPFLANVHYRLEVAVAEFERSAPAAQPVATSPDSAEGAR